MEPDPGKKKRRRSKHKRHRPATTRSPGLSSRSESSRKSERPRTGRNSGVAPTSSFSRVTPSSAPITLEKKKEPPPVWAGYLLGLAGVTLLILLGGGHNLFALSLSLLLPGLALLFHPPSQSPGVWLDRMAVAFLAVLLFSFIPQFYWPDPGWRTSAEQLFQIDLPASLSVQPWQSFEAWVSALAGFGWFYAASSWRINHQGRRWLFFVISVVVGVLALIVLWGNLTGAKYPGAEDSTVFTFFPNRNQTANFLAVGGVAAFAYAMCALRTRRFLPLAGLIASGICFFALVWGISRAGVFLFFGGIVLSYLLQLASVGVPKGIKVGFPILLVAFSIFIVSNSQTAERVIDFVTTSENWSEEFRVLMAKDSLAMIESAPITGHGLGSFAAVFPQYRDLSANHQRAVHPESDILWLGAEAGLLGSALLIGFIIAYLYRCRGLSHGPGGGYRLAALTALLVFMFHALVDVPGHRPGTVYFAILFAALALPQKKGERPTCRPLVWRLCGGGLVILGIIWGASGLTGLPLHSSASISSYESKIKEEVSISRYAPALLQAEKWIDLKPLDWRAYFQRAALTLAQSGARQQAAADFRRARFAEPNLGVVALEEGFAWIPYDTGRTLAAWREVFFRELESPEGAFQRMLDAASKNPELMAGLGRLSEFDAYYRTYFLNYQSGDYLMQELARDLENNSGLSHFSRKQRTAIVKNWIERGDKVSAESFLEAHESGLERPWWLWSLLRKESAKFEDAVNRIRLAITPPALPETTTGEISYERLKREFSLTPGDIIKGTALLDFYLKQDNFRKISELTRTMVDTQKDAPLYVRYWHAESFFRLGDYIESWYAYEEYLKQLWAE